MNATPDVLVGIIIGGTIAFLILILFADEWPKR